MNVKNLVKTAMLSAIAVLLMIYLEIPIPIFPAFLKIDLSDLPVLLGAFAMGPVTGILIELIKNIIHFILKNDGTAGIGNLANFIVGVGFIFPASLTYYKMKSKKGAVIGLGLGIVTMTILSALMNYYVLIPLFAKFYSMEAIIGMMSAANKSITDIKSYIIYAVVPFNIIKAFIVSVITILLYKKVSFLLHK